MYPLYSRLSSQKAIEISSMTFIFLETYRHQNLGNAAYSPFFLRRSSKHIHQHAFMRYTKKPWRLLQDFLRAVDETWTRDIHLGKVVLYQLSYNRNILFSQNNEPEPSFIPTRSQVNTILYRLITRNSYTHNSFHDILQLTIFLRPTSCWLGLIDMRASTYIFYMMPFTGV